MDQIETQNRLEFLKEKTRQLIGKSRYISIAWFAKSAKQAADIARRYGCEEDVVRAVRYAAIIKREFGEILFKEIFDPFDQTQIIDTYSGISLVFWINDQNKKDNDFLNLRELKHVFNMIKDRLEENGVFCSLAKTDELKFEQNDLFLGNRITNQKVE